jgi:hypothetical protein
MPKLGRELLVYFYKLYFSSQEDSACSRNPFIFSVPPATLAQEFNGQDYQTDSRKLKSLLAHLGTSIPEPQSYPG